MGDVPISIFGLRIAQGEPDAIAELRQRLEANLGDVDALARELGAPRRTVYRWLERAELVAVGARLRVANGARDLITLRTAGADSRDAARDLASKRVIVRAYSNGRTTPKLPVEE